MTNLVTPTFRGSYVALIKPKQFANGKPTYGMEIVLPKNEASTKAFIQSLESRFTEAMIEKFGKAVDKKAIKNYPILDGDKAVDKNGEPRNETKGCWIIRSKNEDQPGLLVREADGTKRAITSPGEIYSGAFFVASVAPYAWSNEFGKGVSVSLQGVLKMRDGDKFGGTRFNASDFDGVPADEGDDL